MGQSEEVRIDILTSDERSDDELRTEYATAEFIAAQRYSDADKLKFKKIIREFNEIYYTLSPQTWGSTRWRNVPICKAPTDLWIYQELITAIRPDLIIETGSLFGGSALFMAEMMKLNGNYGWVISIDTDMQHVHENAKQCGMIKFFNASSTSFETLAFVKAHIAAYNAKKVMVILDSDHEHEHVLQELWLYAKFVSIGSALIVEDTSNHPGPKAAVEEWFIEHEETGMKFQPDHMCEKFMLTFNRDGYYERVK